MSKEKNDDKDMDDIGMKNDQIKFLMDENKRLKDMVGRQRSTRQKRQAGSGGGYAGMHQLGGTPNMPDGYSKNRR